MPQPVETTVETGAVQTIQVVAPSDMNGGFEFFVDAGDNMSYKVRVPDEGVKSGQQFHAIISSDPIVKSKTAHYIPTGSWRDGICDCCSLGCGHPVFCLTCWCMCCSLGQVLTRMKMYWFGVEAKNGTTPRPSACVILLIAGILNFVLCVMFWWIYAAGWDCSLTGPSSTGYQPTYFDYDDAYSRQYSGSSKSIYDDDDDYYDRYGRSSSSSGSFRIGCKSKNLWAWFMFILTIILFLIFFCTVTILTRFNLRKKYGIPGSGLEDCCCSFCCTTCTICQLHRHTADFHAYPSGCCSCCSADGLPGSAPKVV
jgi:Cys-rich protein (TIGR01571 family)